MEKPKALEEMSPEELGKLFPVSLSGHRLEWKSLFGAEKKRILGGLSVGHHMQLHHVGSTAIPGICAKPTIDMLLEVPPGCDPQGLQRAMKDLGYFFAAQPQKPPPHMMFMKGYSREGYRGQAFHVHVRFPRDHDELLFRDFLRRHPDVAQHYARLKQRLQRAFEFDREGYTLWKSGFVRSVTARARKERDSML